MKTLYLLLLFVKQREKLVEYTLLNYVTVSGKYKMQCAILYEKRNPFVQFFLATECTSIGELCLSKQIPNKDIDIR